MARELMGRGWSFPITVDANGQIAEASDDDRVRRAIEMILRTAPGEQLMRPEFGAGLETLMHTPNTLATRAKAQETVIEAVRR